MAFQYSTTLRTNSGLRYVAWLFVLMCMAIPAYSATVTINPGSCSGQCVQSAISSNLPGPNTYNLGAGTFNNQIFIAHNGDSFIGAGEGLTIFEGNGATTNQAMINGFDNNTTNITLKNFTVQHYGVWTSNCPIDIGPAAIQGAWNGWVIDHVDVLANGCVGLSILGNAHIIGGRYNNNAHVGIMANQNPVSPPAPVQSPVIVEGAEIFNNNTAHDDPNGSAGGLKFARMNLGATVRYTYVHGNFGVGLWCDGGCGSIHYDYNTVVGNVGPGIFYEISDAGNGNSIFHNVVNDNGTGSWSQFEPGIYLWCTPSTNIQGNNIRIPNAAFANGIILQDESHQGDCNARNLNNDSIQNNIITFVGTVGVHGLFNQNSQSVAGTFSNNNAFHVSNQADLHWSWGTGTAVNWNTYRSTSYAGLPSPDASSTIGSGDASVSGCTATNGSCIGVDPTLGGPPPTVHTPSANGTCLTQGGPTCTLPGANGIITDALGNDYSLVNLGANGFGIQINFQPNYTGAVADPCGSNTPCTDHVIYLISLNGSMYQETSDTSWFVRSGDPSTVNWTATSNPISPLPPPPPAWTGTQRSLNSLLTAIFQAGQSQGIGSPDLRDLSVSADVGTPAVVTATGTNQLTALQLTEQVNIVTAGSVNTGVIANQGRTVVWNMTGNAILVYPEAAASLTYTTTAAPTPTTLGANLPITLPVGSIAQINMVNGTQGYARVW